MLEFVLSFVLVLRLDNDVPDDSTTLGLNAEDKSRTHLNSPCTEPYLTCMRR